MRVFKFLALVWIWSLWIVTAEEVIPGICWFDPPPGLSHSVERNDPGDNSFSLSTKAVTYESLGDQPSNYRLMSFSVRFVGAELGEGKVLRVRPITDDELKQMMPETVALQVTNQPSAVEASLAGKPAFEVARPAPGPVRIFWVRVRPNKVLEIRLAAANQVLLDSMKPLLSAIKIEVSDKPELRGPLKLAQGGMQLGWTHEQVHERCGSALEESPLHERFLTKHYFIGVHYTDGVAMVTYGKITDTEKAWNTLDPRELWAQFVPLSHGEAERLLESQRGPQQLKWETDGSDQWKRADGAKASRSARTKH